MTLPSVSSSAFSQRTHFLEAGRSLPLPRTGGWGVINTLPFPNSAHTARLGYQLGCVTRGGQSWALPCLPPLVFLSIFLLIASLGIVSRRQIAR